MTSREQLRALRGGGLYRQDRLPAQFLDSQPLRRRDYQNDNGNSNSNALQTEVRRSLANGLAFTANFVWSWTYDLPFGKGKAVNLSNGILDRITGGWTRGGVERISTGAPCILNSSRDTFKNRSQSGVVFGSALTPGQLQHQLATIPSLSTVVSGNLISHVASIAHPFFALGSTSVTANSFRQVSSASATERSTCAAS